jgi:molybdopterin synthase catalytic subunit
MRRIVGRIESLWPGTAVAIHHRVGRLFVGETAVLIAVSAPHRAEAFEACREAIEALKREVPIWKREVSTVGATWIGRGP